MDKFSWQLHYIFRISGFKKIDAAKDIMMFILHPLFHRFLQSSSLYLCGTRIPPRISQSLTSYFFKFDVETAESTTEVGLAFLRQIKTTRDKK